MGKIKWSEEVTNEKFIEYIGEKRTLLDSILRKKVNWIRYIIRRNFFLHVDINGESILLNIMFLHRWEHFS